MKYIISFIFSFVLSIFVIAPPLNFAENHYVKCIGFGVLFGLILILLKDNTKRIENLEKENEELKKQINYGSNK